MEPFTIISCIVDNKIYNDVNYIQYVSLEKNIYDIMFFYQKRIL